MKYGACLVAMLLILGAAPASPAPPGSAAAAAADCPTARGVGTISPAISITAITLSVNGVERTPQGDDTLQVSPGDTIEIRKLAICIGPFSGDGGRFCVDISPTDRSGEAIFSEHQGTHMMEVKAGVTEIPVLDFVWVVDESWTNLTAVVNHWTPEKTRDLECADGLCERDDIVVIELR